jgi:hypothetical protein
MARTVPAFTNPFSNLAESAKTSGVIELRDAFDWSFSYYTISGTVSRHTLQLSNAYDIESIPEASWSVWTHFGTTGLGSVATIKFPPLGVRFARILRKASGASITININKLVK